MSLKLALKSRLMNFSCSYEFISRTALSHLYFATSLLYFEIHWALWLRHKKILSQCNSHVGVSQCNSHVGVNLWWYRTRKFNHFDHSWFSVSDKSSKYIQSKLNQNGNQLIARTSINQIYNFFSWCALFRKVKEWSGMLANDLYLIRFSCWLSRPIDASLIFIAIDILWSEYKSRAKTWLVFDSLNPI